jgi:uncharacterized membrane protein YhaH (DUF805 family)
MLKYRMNRPTYWLCFVIFVAAGCALAYLGKLNGGMEMAMLVIGVPRLHDIGRSGWIVGAVILAEVMIVVGILLAGASVDTLEIAGGVIVLAVAALGIFLGIIPGESGPNKWGEQPGRGVQFRRKRTTA